VAEMTVGRITMGVNNIGTCTVVVVDDVGLAVSGASVTVNYDGPNSGTITGVTDAAGEVDFRTPRVKNPSGEWCFEVTGVSHASLSYDAGANVVTRSCESGDVYREGVAASPVLALRNFPNPFNPTTTIEFALPRETTVSMQVFDAQGRLVVTLVNGSLAAGTHSVTWDARSQPSGIYFYRVAAGVDVAMRKMVLLK